MINEVVTYKGIKSGFTLQQFLELRNRILDPYTRQSFIDEKSNDRLMARSASVAGTKKGLTFRECIELNRRILGDS